jgi:hypothetical protein
LANAFIEGRAVEATSFVTGSVENQCRCKLRQKKKDESTDEMKEASTIKLAPINGISNAATVITLSAVREDSHSQGVGFLASSGIDLIS